MKKNNKNDKNGKNTSVNKSSSNKDEIIYNLNADFKSHIVEIVVNKEKYLRTNWYKPFSFIQISQTHHDLEVVNYLKKDIKSTNRSLAAKKRHEKTKFEKWLNNYLFVNREFPSNLKRTDIEEKYGKIDWAFFENELETYKINYKRQDEIIKKRFCFHKDK